MSHSTEFPLVIEAEGGESLVERVKDRRESLRASLLEHGALLLRGFSVPDVSAFDSVVRELSGDPLTYTERSSPRSAIQGQVYTSTDYPRTKRSSCTTRTPTSRLGPWRCTSTALSRR